MDPATHKHLERAILAVVPGLFSVGDRVFLQSLSRGALVEALEQELCFVGLDAFSDRATQAAIHTILEQHIDHWRQEYGVQSSAPFSATY